MDDRLRGICSTHGVFLRSEALALGYDDRAIAQEVRTKGLAPGPTRRLHVH